MSTAELKSDASPKLVTAEELLRDYAGRRCELIRGTVRLMSPTGFEFGSTADEVAYQLNQVVRPGKLGRVVIAEAGFLIARDPDTVRAPDVAYVSASRLKAAGDQKKYFPTAPDLAVEVVSPNDAASEVHEKAREWIEAGCRAVWLVWPDDRSVTVYRSLDSVKILTDDALLDGVDVVPGFSCPVSQFFKGMS
ncbi:MAG: Uma2 family endonuclease [Planctomycetota bacterium]